MALPEAKKNYLKAMGYSDEQIASIEGGANALGKEAQESGVESKETSTTETTTTPPTDEVKPDAQTTETQPPVPEGEKKEAAAEFVTKEEFVATVAEALLMNNAKLLEQIKELIEKSVTPLGERVDALDKKQSDLSVTPTASLAAIIAKQMTAIGDEETQLRKDSKLSKQAPESTKEDGTSGPVLTGNPIFDNMVPKLWKETKPGGN